MKGIDRKKKRMKTKFVFVCPVCGNDAAYRFKGSKLCKFCRSLYTSAERVKVKSTDI